MVGVGLWMVGDAWGVWFGGEGGGGEGGRERERGGGGRGGGEREREQLEGRKEIGDWSL